MYSKQDYDRYSAMLRESGIIDDGQIQSILDFAYQLAVIAANIYKDNLNQSQNGAQKKAQENQSGPD